MTHTPGPWLVREPEDGELHEIYAANGGDLICYPVWTKNQQANVPLIAAAPELLAALHEVAATCRLRQLHASDGSGDLEILRLCNAAIAKAEGRGE